MTTIEVRRAVKAVIDDYDEPVKIQTFVKISVEPLSTHAFATKQIRQGKRGQSIVDVRQAISCLNNSEVVGEREENGMEVMVQRLDRLTQGETRVTAAKILEGPHCLVQYVDGK